MEPAPSSTASAPFDRADANVILRSSDAVDFHVHKHVLAVASPVFDDVLALPQPANAADQDVHPINGLPIVRVAEDRATLDRLLRLCYPVADPVLEDVSDVGVVLAAAMKYEMDEAVAVLTKLLHDAIEEHALRVYAVACGLGMEPVAKVAAVAVSSKRDIVYRPEMDQMSAGEFYRLLHFRRMKQRNAAVFAFCRSSMRGGGAGTLPELPPRESNASHPFVHTFADIILQSSDGVHFHVFRSMLTLASPVFNDVLRQRPDLDSISPGGLRIISVTEDSRTMSRILRLCYPMEEPEIEDFDTAHAVLEAAMKYKLARATEFARKKWTEYIESCPLRAYFVAMRHKCEAEAAAAKCHAAGRAEEELWAREAARKWEEVVRDAARHAVYKPHDLYTAEMEDVSARVYHRLLEYRQRCREVISCVSSQFGFPEYDTKHWSAFGHGADPAYDQFLVDVRSTTTVPQKQSSCAVLAAPVVERAIQHYSSSSLQELVQESQRLEVELRQALSQVELCTT